MEYKSLFIFISIVFFGVLETICPFFQYRQGAIKIFSTNLILGLINAIGINLLIALILKWVWKQTIWLGLFDAINIPWLEFSLSFFLLDLYMYVWHRLMHSSSLGWNFHLVHHTDRYINISTAYRFHIIEVILSNLPKIFLIYLFGIEINNLIFYESLFAISLIFHHSNLALNFQIDKFVSYLIVTPNYHRFHHSQMIEATNSNYSSLLTIWDVIFQSRYYPLFPETIKLGVAQENRDFNFIQLLKLPFMARNRE
ncbi:sterol desaturase family protein [Sphaerospermopsis aphanizomenoides BCCUSP55]|uniref:sterol desaturase family protein n=1 Tax=Sphaerospermopsis aphanizomenoides TaxID=459663 RepID=UPI001903692E|nr:sterol desaturase family protein [Sphaerospermopsis aphanizomenoides]MBK1987229.1 sterol desaturase family protein [Sphaerospermopsis aphanizomenoides BCCUSP55]